MRILVFEFLTGGGIAEQRPLDESTKTFLQQGHLMFHAVCKDLVQLGHEVVAPVDHLLELPIPAEVDQRIVHSESEVDSTLLKTSEEADCILLIAPESEGLLEHYAALLSPFATRFVSPDIEFIQLAANKWNTHRWLSERKVSCPMTKLIANKDEIALLPDSFFPCVSKPVDGAGSEQVRLLDTRGEIKNVRFPALLQEYCTGIPVSISIISKPNCEPIILEPGRQVFETEPFGRHLRTEFSLSSSLRERAIALATCTAEALPRTRGYFGIDMVLGDDPANDVVIEVNPRLTTSYAFLRERSGENLARHFPFDAITSVLSK